MFDRKIEEMIEQVQKPARYIGGEMNTAVKAWEDAEVHFAFCFRTPMKWLCRTLA